MLIHAFIQFSIDFFSIFNNKNDYYSQLQKKYYY